MTRLDYAGVVFIALMILIMVTALRDESEIRDGIAVRNGMIALHSTRGGQ